MKARQVSILPGSQPVIVTDRKVRAKEPEAVRDTFHGSVPLLTNAPEQPLPRRAQPSTPVVAPGQPVSEDTSEVEAQLALVSRRAVRGRQLPEVCQLGRALHQGELEGQDFQKAATRLRQLAFESPDPWVRKQASSSLRTYLEWDDPAQDLLMKLGAQEGALHALSDLLDRAGGQNRLRLPLADQRIVPYLEALAEVTPQPKTLRVVAHCLRLLEAREEAPLESDVQKQESTADRRRWISACHKVLERWHQQGHLQVKGSLVVPGDLGKLCFSTEGLTIQIHRELPPTEKAEEFLSSVESVDEQELARRFERLDPELAQSVTEQIVSLALQPQDHQDWKQWGRTHRRIAQLLTHLDESGLQAFRPQLPRLKRFFRTMEARGGLPRHASEGHAQGALVGALARRFPEILDREFLEEELLPCYFSELNAPQGLDPVIRELVKSQPWSRSSIFGFCQKRDQDPWMETQSKNLLSTVLKAGYQPTPLQQDNLATWLQPATGQSLMNDSSFEWAWTHLSRLPGFSFESLEICDPKGRMRPLPDTIMEYVLDDRDGDSTKRFTEHSQAWPLAREVFGLGRLPENRVEELLAGVEEAAQEQLDLSQLPDTERVHLGILSSISLPDDAQKRLRNIYRRRYSTEQNCPAIRSAMSQAREQDVADCVARLQKNELSPEEALNTAREAARIELSAGRYFQPPKLDEPYYSALWEALNRDRQAGSRALRELLEEPLRESARSGRSEELSAESVAALFVAAGLGEQDPFLRSQWVNLSQPLAGRAADETGNVEQLMARRRLQADAASSWDQVLQAELERLEGAEAVDTLEIEMGIDSVTVGSQVLDILD